MWGSRVCGAGLQLHSSCFWQKQYQGGGGVSGVEEKSLCVRGVVGAPF